MRNQFGAIRGLINRSAAKMFCSKQMINTSVLVSVAFMVFMYMTYSTKGNWVQRTTSSAKHIPEYASYKTGPVNRIDESRTGIDGNVHGNSRKGMNTRTLTELMADENADSVFSVLASVTQHRKGLPNYYIHGLKSGISEDYAKCNIAFLHLHKAGGTTTKAVLRKVHRKARMGIVKMSHSTTTDAFDHFLKIRRTSKPTLFWGGFSFGICDILRGRPCSYMTVLRDPYDRIISSYFFCQRNAVLCGPVYPRKVSITTWAIHQGSHFFNQLLIHPDTCRNDSSSDEYVKLYQNHTKDIIKYVHSHEDACWFRQKALHKETLTKEQRRALLSYILENLDNWFAVIGMLEDFQSSLHLFGEAYRMNFTAEYSEPLNKGETRDKTEYTQIKQMKNELINSAEVREALYEDIMIYEKGLEIFKVQKEEYSILKNRSKDNNKTIF